MKFPCELVVWKVLPAIKASLTRKMKKQGLKQKDIANLLDITEAAVSQYLSRKRAAKFKIPEKIDPMIDIITKAIVKEKNPEILMYGVCEICKEIRTSGSACKDCKSNSEMPKNCSLCKK